MPKPLSPDRVALIVKEHNAFWRAQLPEMRKFKHAYATRMLEKEGNDLENPVELSRGYEFVEGFVSALFDRDPAVRAGPDLAARGDRATCAAVANEFLKHGYREDGEVSSRLALIYTHAFVALEPVEHPDPLQRVRTTPMEPWDVVLDLYAKKWDRQRWVMRRYWLPIEEAAEKWTSGETKDFGGRAFRDYLNTTPTDEVLQSMKDETGEWVRVYEVYDLRSDKLFIWCPQFKGGKEFLDDGVEVEVGDGDAAKTVKVDRIICRDADDRPVVPIVPVYLSFEPDAPLKGMSALHRVYDLIREFNISRSNMLAASKRYGRQLAARKGLLTDDAKDAIRAGADGEVVEIESQTGEDLRKSIVPLDFGAVPAELGATYNHLLSDWGQASLTAPFTRGQVAGGRTTAQEIDALMSYSNSELGKTARRKDAVTENVARVYVDMLRFFLGEDKLTVALDEEAVVLSADKLDGRRRYYAEDGGSTPTSRAGEKNEFLAVTPTLVDVLQVPLPDVRKEFLRRFRLPSAWNESAEAAPPAPPPAPPAGAGGLPPGPPGVAAPIN